MSDEPQVQVHPLGLEEEHPHGPPTAVITYRGCQLVLRFASGDFQGEGDIQELRVLPDTETLKPRVLRQFAPNAETYLQYARAAMQLLGRPEGTPEERWEKFRGAGEAFREISGPGRGHPPGFFRVVAMTYNALVAEGEPHPVKALSEKHHVKISTASRWITEARRRKLIEPKGGKSGAR